ncbi:gamma carbonic anhydrase family protein [Deferribacterales bacterium RsTz2092]|nr:gamma carbonic anhydrase family protein [Deferribacterales bacterium]
MENVRNRLLKGITRGERVFIADGATVVGDVRLADDVGIWYGVVLRGDVDYISIGRGSNIQDNAVLHVTKDSLPCIVGEDTTIGHNVCLHGCTIGNGVLVGIGAVVLDGAVIPDGCIVGGGSLVPPKKIFPPRSMLMGFPAKVVREVTDADIAATLHNSQKYVHLKDLYLELKPARAR